MIPPGGGPSALRRRKSIRLKGYDYSQAGAYFVTLCTHNRQNMFGEIVAGEMQLNDYGQIAHDQWQQIPQRFENVALDQFVVMPNHVHGILIITDPAPIRAGFTPAPTGCGSTPTARVGAGFTPAQAAHQVGFTPALPETGQPQTGQPQTGQPQGLPLLGNIVGAYKSLVAHECLKICKTRNEFLGKLWQRNYWEHIIRDQESYDRIAEYIANNPAQWDLDSLHAGNRP